MDSVVVEGINRAGDEMLTEFDPPDVPPSENGNGGHGWNSGGIPWAMLALAVVLLVAGIYLMNRGCDCGEDKPDGSPTD